MTNIFNNIILNLKYGLRLNKPLLIFRLIIAYLKVIFLNSQSLRYIDFATNYNCNFKCKHCFATVLTKKGTPILTIDEYKKISSEAMKLGAVSFAFQGGEVLLKKDLEQVIKAFKPNRNYIAVTTNAFLLNDEWIEKLKKWGVDKITISLDSGIAEEHDFFRGVQGAFLKAYAAIDKVLKHKMKVTVNITVSHHNIRTEGFKKIIDLALDRKVIVNPIFAVPVGNWENNLDILLTEEDKKYIADLQKKTPYLRRDIDSNWKTRGCSAVREVLYISPYGDVLPCPFIHITLGNIKDESLKDIIEKGKAREFLNTYHKTCLVAENRIFIDRYMKIVKEADELPIPIKKVNIDAF